MREEWFTVAERLKVKHNTVRDWLKSEQLRGRNFGGRTGWRVRHSDLEAFLDTESKMAA
jgi:excisionase family DNA binding protein